MTRNRSFQVQARALSLDLPGVYRHVRFEVFIEFLGQGRLARYNVVDL